MILTPLDEQMKGRRCIDLEGKKGCCVVPSIVD